MPWSSSDIPDQTGRTAIVTGANSGLGMITARELAGHGARVVLACRDLHKGKAAVKGMRSKLGSAIGNNDLTAAPLDLASLDSIREFAEQFEADNPDGLDLLINNAGVMASPHRKTADGFELQFGTNHLGHFALTGRLLEALKRRPSSRVVTISSNAHKGGKINFEDLQSEGRYRRWSVYAQSKLANLIFALDLQKRLTAHDLEIESMAAHPGYSATNLTTAGTGLGSDIMSTISKPIMKVTDALVGQDAEHGALPTLYAATVTDLAGGSYIGPDGIAEMRGSPVVVAPRPKAENADLADRLWQVSTDLTKVEYEF